jgi:Tfp pilus assembly PilM family ATPase
VAKIDTSKPFIPKKPGACLGIEWDASVIRGAKVSHGGPTGYYAEALIEERGDFESDAALIDGLKKVKNALSPGAKDGIATSLAGKQVYTSQIPFRVLDSHEMESALRLEIRKSLPFDIHTSALDFLRLSEPEGESELAQFLIVAAHNSLITRQLKVLQKASLEPTIVEALPLTLANALWAQVGTAKTDAPMVALHLGPQVCTVVIDGEKTPYFHRNVYFAADALFGESSASIHDRDREKRLELFGEEIARSLAYYEKNALVGGFGHMLLFGDYLTAPELGDTLRRHTGLQPTRAHLAKRFGYSGDTEPGRFDLALALALRGGA